MCMNPKRILKEYVSLCLSEAAINSAAASKAGLGVIINKSGNKNSIVLFDVKKAAMAIKADIKNTNYQSILEPAIVGFITLTPAERGPQYGALSVKAVASIKGYGPLLYDLAMTTFGKIAPDRMKVSPSAQNVWGYYSKNRNDVEKLPFDDIKNPQTPDKNDDAYMHPGGTTSPLNAAYTGADVNISSLQKNAQKLFSWSEGNQLNVNDISQALEFAGHSFYRKNHVD